ncbi:hypothetical protein ZIOFF_050684 [Zingiber officinale]|uniref:Reverse transcriptase domain-containing protein n=1 Tax=Zingiber officinale TaxID=94328 RepID=A0A8J5FJC1_ZINOF|nr:hypothetical protein ZIOFF_050684 [Zingiber officinale]
MPSTNSHFLSSFGALELVENNEKERSSLGPAAHQEDGAFGENEATHEKHLRIMLEICKRDGLVLSPTKMKIAVKEIEFLGAILGNRRNKLQPHIIKKIVSFNEEDLATKKGLKSWLGILNYARNYIPNLGKLLSPLYGKTSNTGEKQMNQQDWDLVKLIKEKVMAAKGGHVDNYTSGDLRLGAMDDGATQGLGYSPGHPLSGFVPDVIRCRLPCLLLLPRVAGRPTTTPRATTIAAAGDATVMPTVAAAPRTQTIVKNATEEEERIREVLNKICTFSSNLGKGRVGNQTVESTSISPGVREEVASKEGTHANRRKIPASRIVSQRKSKFQLQHSIAFQILQSSEMARFLPFSPYASEVFSISILQVLKVLQGQIPFVASHYKSSLNSALKYSSNTTAILFVLTQCSIENSITAIQNSKFPRLGVKAKAI